MKKRFLCLTLTVLLMVPMVVSAAEIDGGIDPIEERLDLSEETVERVKEEVLSGEITSQEDVLTVALMQYCDTNQDTQVYDLQACSVDEDEPLKIVQVVDETVDAEGNTSETVAVTALLVLDEDGQSVSAAEYYTNYRMTGNKGLNQYSVFATHTTYLKSRTTTADGTFVRVYYMNTVLTYGTSMTASKLLHRCAYSRDIADWDSGYIEDSPVNNPVAGTKYMFTPFSSADDGWVPRGILGAYVQTSVEVFVGGTSFTICNTLRMDADFSEYEV